MHVDISANKSLAIIVITQSRFLSTVKFKVGASCGNRPACSRPACSKGSYTCTIGNQVLLSVRSEKQDMVLLSYRILRCLYWLGLFFESCSLFFRLS